MSIAEDLTDVNIAANTCIAYTNKTVLPAATAPPDDRGSLRISPEWLCISVPLPEHQNSCQTTPVFAGGGEGPPDRYLPRTPLGKRLIDLRRQAIRGGMRLLGEEEVLREVKRRRGELEGDEADLS